MSTLYITCAQAKSNKPYHQEPTLPVYQAVEFDEARARPGEKLFVDPRLSVNNIIACASYRQLIAGTDDNATTGRILTVSDIHLIESFLNTLTVKYKNKPMDLQS